MVQLNTAWSDWLQLAVSGPSLSSLPLSLLLSPTVLFTLLPCLLLCFLSPLPLSPLPHPSPQGPPSFPLSLSLPTSLSPSFPRFLLSFSPSFPFYLSEALSGNEQELQIESGSVGQPSPGSRRRSLPGGNNWISLPGGNNWNSLPGGNNCINNCISLPGSNKLYQQPNQLARQQS